MKLNLVLSLVTLIGLATPLQAQSVTLSADDNASSSFTGNVTFGVDNLTYTVADGVSIEGDYANASGVTGSTLHFAGSSTDVGTIGSSASLFDRVIFNSADNGSTVSLSNDVWASSVILGNGVSNETEVTLSGSGLTFGGNVSFANFYTLLEVGTTRNTITGTLNLNAGALAFTLGTDSNFTFQDGTGSGKITTGALTLTGTDLELFLLTYTGSVKDGASYTLIENNGAVVGSYEQEESSGYVADNSYVINSAVATDSAGNVVLTTSRSAEEYITKSYSSGHFSNGAALALGTIAQQGRQQGDLADVIKQIDINDYGYGDNYANLATQVQLLAPVANNSFGTTLLDATNLALHSTSERMYSHAPRLEWEARSPYEVWTSGYLQQGSQNGLDFYDGYETQIQGAVVGADLVATPEWMAGVAAASGRARITQMGFREGEQADLNLQLYTLYASLNQLPYTVDLAFSSGSGVLKSKRATAVDRVASGEQDYGVKDIRLSGGFRNLLDDGRSVLTPLAGLEWSELTQSSYQETGAGDLSLSYEGKTQHRLRWMVGVAHEADLQVWETETRWTLSLLNYRDNGLTNLDIESSFTGTTDASLRPFTTPTKSMKTDELQLKTDLDFEVWEKAHFKLGYRLDHRTGFNAHTGSLKFGWRF